MDYLPTSASLPKVLESAQQCLRWMFPSEHILPPGLLLFDLSAKLLVFLIFLANAPSWPFVWMYRVWSPAAFQHLHLFRVGDTKFLEEWCKQSAAKGGIMNRTRVSRRAWFDDCDQNIHLSNSSYAKSADAAIMQFALDTFSPCLGTGVMSILAGSHFAYFKEIPLGTEYTMEVRLGGWGEKWFYLVIEYLTYPSSAKATTRRRGPSLFTDGLPVPTPPTIRPKKESKNGIPDTLDAVKETAQRPGRVRDDGATVCCVAVMEQCFKIGRITVPPRIAFFLAVHSPDAAQRDRARRILLDGNDRGAKWMKEGWKDEPDAATIGQDVGVIDVMGSKVDWVARGRQGMEDVKASLKMFDN